MKALYTLVSSAVLGVLLGYIGGPVQILAIWGIAGVGIGYFSSTFRLAALNGLIFGFIVSYIFMLHGYNGTDPITTKLLPFAALGAFGAVCGIILAEIGRLLRKLMNM